MLGELDLADVVGEMVGGGLVVEAGASGAEQEEIPETENGYYFTLRPSAAPPPLRFKPETGGQEKRSQSLPQ